MENSYEYRDLDSSARQIRLLNLFPASEKDAQIQVSLETATFPTEGHTYEAISYTWGDQTVKHRVHTDSGDLKVSQNLYDALLCLRHENQSRALWVDALCINQANKLEKNHQVRQMGDIYFHASRVLVWLGKSDEEIAQAMEFFRDTQENRDKREMPMPGLEKIFSNPWWYRMWVIQEVALARLDPIVCCGYESAPWDAVSFTLFKLCWDTLFSGSRPQSEFLRHDPESLSYWVMTRHGRGPTRGRSLDHLLEATINQNSTDLQDHIYALLGLLPGEAGASIEIDYSQPERICYQEAMVSVFSIRQDLNWLIFAARGSDSSPCKQPSWCIDFSMKDWKKKAKRRGWHYETFQRKYQTDRGIGADGGRQMGPLFHGKLEGTLTVSGTRVGTIDSRKMATTGPFRNSDEISMTTESEAQSFLHEIIRRLLRDVSRFTVLCKLALDKRLGPVAAAERIAGGDVWKVAAGCKDPQSLFPKTDQPIGKDFPENGFAFLESVCQKSYRFSAMISTDWKGLLPEVPEDFSETAYLAYARIAHLTGDSCYFTTDSGYIGIAGHAVEEGDVVCILFGCRLPAVLRPRSDGSYTLVAFTHTHEVMEAEFLADPNSVLEEVFLLR